jgi:hypothetical protein
MWTTHLFNMGPGSYTRLLQQLYLREDNNFSYLLVS